MVGLVMLGLAALSGRACADTIELMNGVRVEGVVIETRGGGIVVRVQDRNVWIPQDRVRSITFAGAAPAPAPEPAPVAAPTPEPAPTAPPPASAPTAPRPPRPIPPEIAAAISAMDRLQAATGKALPPADYGTRIEATRQEVERALGGIPDEEAVRRALAVALQYHALAAQAASVYAARGDLTSIPVEPLLTDCRPLGEFIARDAAQLKLNPASPAVAGLLVATEGGPLLRECAGEKIAEAESLARAPR